MYVSFFLIKKKIYQHIIRPTKQNAQAYLSNLIVIHNKKIKFLVPGIWGEGGDEYTEYISFYEQWHTLYDIIMMHICHYTFVQTHRTCNTIHFVKVNPKMNRGLVDYDVPRQFIPGLKKKKGASLVAQWLRICLPMQGTWVRALVWEDPTCRGATKPWATAAELARLEPVLGNGEAATVRGPRAAMKSGPRSPQLEKALAQKRRPNTAKNK